MREPGLPSVLVVLASSQRRGAEISGVALATALAQRGLRTDVVAIAETGEPSPLPVDAIGGGHRSPSTLRALRRRTADYDVVIAYGSTTLPACVAALAGTRTRLVYRSIGRPRDWIRSRAHRLRTASLYARVDHVVTLWDAAADDVQQLFHVPSAKVCSIPTGYALDEWTSSGRVEPERYRLSIIGSLSEEKMVDRAIDAVALVPDVELQVVGGGPLRPQLERHVASLTADQRARISFTGRVADVRPTLSASTALVLTSRTEGIPGVIIEAALMGVPSFAVDVGAVGAIIQHGTTGVVMASNAPDVVAGYLREWREPIITMGPAAEAKVRSAFGWDTVAPQWIELLRRVSDRA